MENQDRIRILKFIYDDFIPNQAFYENYFKNFKFIINKDSFHYEKFIFFHNVLPVDFDFFVDEYTIDKSYKEYGIELEEAIAIKFFRSKISLLPLIFYIFHEVFNYKDVNIFLDYYEDDKFDNLTIDIGPHDPYLYGLNSSSIIHFSDMEDLPKYGFYELIDKYPSKIYCDQKLDEERKRIEEENNRGPFF